MTTEQRYLLVLIESGGMYGNGTVFRCRGVDCSSGVLWALANGYATWSMVTAGEPVLISQAGRAAARSS